MVSSFLSMNSSFILRRLPERDKARILRPQLLVILFGFLNQMRKEISMSIVLAAVFVALVVLALTVA